AHLLQPTYNQHQQRASAAASFQSRYALLLLYHKDRQTDAVTDNQHHTNGGIDVLHVALFARYKTDAVQ
ncbi:hypothetical protein, partial [Klebsiella variicola]|uniref:hypothetical protein n=1 Tax=Klebsiella variicola TaxID=244366 RepID=UPI001F5FA02E